MGIALIWILGFFGFLFIASIIVSFAIWIIHKISNAMICEDIELKRELDSEEKL